MEQTAIAVGTDLCTQSWAAEHIGVSLRTVQRLVAENVLQGVRPRIGSRETGRRHNLLWTDEVREYARDRKKWAKSDG